MYVPGHDLPWLQVLPVKPGWHLHLLGPTHSPCLQPGWHSAIVEGFKEEEERDEHSYQITATKHLIPLIVDLAVNNLVDQTLNIRKDSVITTD